MYCIIGMMIIFQTIFSKDEEIQRLQDDLSEALDTNRSIATQASISVEDKVNTSVVCTLITFYFLLRNSSKIHKTFEGELWVGF